MFISVGFSLIKFLVKNSDSNKFEKEVKLKKHGKILIYNPDG